MMHYISKSVLILISHKLFRVCQLKKCTFLNTAASQKKWRYTKNWRNSKKENIKKLQIFSRFLVSSYSKVQGNLWEDNRPKISARSVKRLQCLCTLTGKSQILFCFLEALITSFRNSCSQEFHKIRNKTRVLNSVLNNVAGLKKRFRHKCFPANLAKFLRKPFSQNTSGRLLLKRFKDIF